MADLAQMAAELDKQPSRAVKCPECGHHETELHDGLILCVACGFRGVQERFDPGGHPTIQVREIRTPDEHDRIFGEAVFDVAVALGKDQARALQDKVDARTAQARVRKTGAYSTVYRMGEKLKVKVLGRAREAVDSPFQGSAEPTNTKNLSLAELAEMT